MNHHLAQINIAKLIHPEGHSSNAFFFESLDMVNTLAARSDGFVWRWEDFEDPSLVAGLNDPFLVINMSLWESIEALHAFAFNTVHRKVFARRAEFFTPLEGPHAVLWWMPKGQVPDLAMARDKLNELAANGPGPAAFTFADRFAPDGSMIMRAAAQ